MARFQGNVHASSDRAAATVMFIVLLAVVLLALWWVLNPVGFADAAGNFGINVMPPATPTPVQ